MIIIPIDEIVNILSIPSLDEIIELNQDIIISTFSETLSTTNNEEKAQESVMQLMKRLFLAIKMLLLKHLNKY